MSHTLRVAIIGGGLAGCTLANGLQGHDGITCDVFEAKSSFSERGASVGLGVNAQAALRTMGIAEGELLQDAGAVLQEAMPVYIGQGPHKDDIMLDLPGGNKSVARDLFLRKLVKRLPAERLHVNKKLVSSDNADYLDDAPLKIHFADGETVEADVVVACDGIHSHARQIILGPDDPAARPIFGGYWDARGFIPIKAAVELFGNRIIDPSHHRVVAIAGDGVCMVFAPVTRGEQCAAVVSGVAGPGYDQTAWKTEITRELLEEHYRGWDENLRTGVIDCLLSTHAGPKDMLSQWESPAASTYIRGRIAMIGDSAHATTPWLGMGAAMATEDCCVMARLLRKAKTRRDAVYALAAYDEARRGRPEAIVRYSQEAAKLLTGQHGLSPAAAEQLGASGWWKYAWDIDMEAHVKDVLADFERRRSE